jgi:hypothetical protein
MILPISVFIQYSVVLRFRLIERWEKKASFSFLQGSGGRRVVSETGGHLGSMYAKHNQRPCQWNTWQETSLHILGLPPFWSFQCDLKFKTHNNYKQGRLCSLSSNINELSFQRPDVVEFTWRINIHLDLEGRQDRKIFESLSFLISWHYLLYQLGMHLTSSNSKSN